MRYNKVIHADLFSEHKVAILYPSPISALAVYPHHAFFQTIPQTPHHLASRSTTHPHPNPPPWPRQQQHPLRPDVS